MNSKRGFFSMPPVDLGLHFDGIGALPRLKLHPQIARKMLLEAHRWTGEEALKDGVVDAIADPEEMLEVAVELANKWKSKAKMGVYSVLRAELWGEALQKFRNISTKHSQPFWTAPTANPPSFRLRAWKRNFKAGKSEDMIRWSKNREP